MQVFQINFHKEHLINIGFKDLLIMLVLYLSTPDSTNASKDMHFYYIKRIQDVGDYTNATDIPFRFVPCMTSGLAFYLSQKYQPQLVQQMKLYYEDELARALQKMVQLQVHLLHQSLLPRN